MSTNQRSGGERSAPLRLKVSRFGQEHSSNEEEPKRKRQRNRNTDQVSSHPKEGGQEVLAIEAPAEQFEYPGLPCRYTCPNAEALAARNVAPMREENYTDITSLTSASPMRSPICLKRQQKMCDIDANELQRALSASSAVQDRAEHSEETRPGSTISPQSPPRDPSPPEEATPTRSLSSVLFGPKLSQVLPHPADGVGPDATTTESESEIAPPF